MINVDLDTCHETRYQSYHDIIFMGRYPPAHLPSAFMRPPGHEAVKEGKICSKSLLVHKQMYASL